MKTKERIHGMLQSSYKLLPWMCQHSLEGCIDCVRHDFSPSGGDDDADGVSYGDLFYLVSSLKFYQALDIV